MSLRNLLAKCIILVTELPAMEENRYLTQHTQLISFMCMKKKMNESKHNFSVTVPVL